MENIAYVVMCDNGEQYEDHNRWIEKIFLNPEAANNYAEERNRNNRFIPPTVEQYNQLEDIHEFYPTYEEYLEDEESSWMIFFSSYKWYVSEHELITK